MNAPKFTVGQAVRYYNAYFSNYTISAVSEKDGQPVYTLANGSNDRLAEGVEEIHLMAIEGGRLAHLWERAYRAYSGTSFSPEKRAFTTIRDYEAELTADLAELEAKGASAESLEDYATRFVSLFGSWLGAKGNCISTMITGGSKFPVRRAEKANRSEERHYEIFAQWRDRAKKGIVRKMQPVKTVSSELDRMRSEVERAKKTQDYYKAVNVAIRKCKGNADALAALLSFRLDTAQELLKPDFCGRIGIPSYKLTNNLANIKRMEQRVKELEQKEANQSAAPQTTAVKGEGWELVQNNEADRYQFIFDSKPGESIRSLLKSHGYKWAPSQNAWQRQITGNACYVTSKLLLPKLRELLAA